MPPRDDLLRVVERGSRRGRYAETFLNPSCGRPSKPFSFAPENTSPEQYGTNTWFQSRNVILAARVHHRRAPGGVLPLREGLRVHVVGRERVVRDRARLTVEARTAALHEDEGPSSSRWATD